MTEFFLNHENNSKYQEKSFYEIKNGSHRSFFRVKLL
jgi:hypothetical protein